MLDQGNRSGPSRQQAVRRVLWIVLVLNLAVALAKLIIGRSVGSLSMVADGYHSLADSASNVVGLVGLAIAARPPDENHPYGHQRFETLAALAIGGFLTLTAWEVLRSCLHRLRGGGTIERTPLALGVMLATLAVNLAVTVYERRRGRQLRSGILQADARHTLSDVYASLMVIAGLVAATVGQPAIDLIAAVVITGMIAFAAFQILRENGLLLADTALIDPGVIRAEATAVPGVLSVHKVRSRGRIGEGQADLHIQVPADMPIADAHAIGHQVADRLRERFALREVLVHVEPPVD
jgi:cation diffusion facilitator family transporter